MYIFYTCGYISSPKKVDFGQFEAKSCATIGTSKLLKWQNDTTMKTDISNCNGNCRKVAECFSQYL